MRSKIVSSLVVAFSLGVVQAASAADMPVKAPMAAPVYNWGGCYVGGFAGYKTGKVHHATAATPDFADYNAKGGLGGLDVGCNYQTGIFVLGVEGDIAWLGVKGDGNAPNPAFTLQAKETWLGTLRARAGVAFDRWLPYVTGGFALANWKQSETAPAGAAVLTMEQSKVLSGLVIGGGLEYAVTNNWLMKGEFLYINYGTNSFFDPATACTGCSAPQDIKHNNYIYKIGVNYKF
jgi:outer membrane immunogenic protein